MKDEPEKVIECYMDTDFSGGWNQEEGKDIRLVLSIMGYVSIYANCLIIWTSRLQTEMALSRREAEFIGLSQAIRDLLPFVSLMEDFEFILKIQGDTLTGLVHHNTAPEKECILS